MGAGLDARHLARLGRGLLGGIDVLILSAAYWRQFTVDAWDSDDSVVDRVD